MQKKSRNSRGKKRAMETHFYTMEFFFLSREFFYIHSERFLTIFLYALFVFPEKWMQKKSRNSRGKKRAMETHFYTMFFFYFFQKNFPMNTQNHSLQFFLCRASISRVMNAKKSRNLQKFLRFSRKFPVFSALFRVAPNFSEHQILACTKF